MNLGRLVDDGRAMDNYSPLLILLRPTDPCLLVRSLCWYSTDVPWLGSIWGPIFNGKLILEPSSESSEDFKGSA